MIINTVTVRKKDGTDKVIEDVAYIEFGEQGNLRLKDSDYELVANIATSRWKTFTVTNAKYVE